MCHVHVGALLIYLGLITLLGGIGWLLFTPLVSQVGELANQRLPILRRRRRG